MTQALTVLKIELWEWDLKKYLITGLLIWFPILITVLVVRGVLDFSDYALLLLLFRIVHMIYLGFIFQVLGWYWFLFFCW